MKLLAFSGRKQSGKDTAARFLIDNTLYFFTNQEHRFFIPMVKRYYFGSGMKRFCEEYLGVPKELLWGTDEQKNQLTNIHWEHLPYYRDLWIKLLGDKISKYGVDMEQWPKEARRPRGPMTVRELLQQVGEEMFLKMHPRIWLDRFAAEIKSDEGLIDVAINPDPRKPEQIDEIHRLGGKVIRLLRDPYAGADKHISETALDEGVYDQGNFDAIIDNRDLTVEHTHVKVFEVLSSWGWVPRGPYEKDIIWVP